MDPLASNTTTAERAAARLVPVPGEPEARTSAFSTGSVVSPALTVTSAGPTEPPAGTPGTASVKLTVPGAVRTADTVRCGAGAACAAADDPMVHATSTMPANNINMFGL